MCIFHFALTSIGSVVPWIRPIAVNVIGEYQAEGLT
jgi:hypothetical protein